jgi:hypothetical protein
MENSELHEQAEKKNNRGQYKGFSDLMQEAFVLHICGLTIKQIFDEMKHTSEDAVEKLLERVIHFYKLDNGYCSMNIAVAKAVKSGFVEELLNKYREKHSKHIERFERSEHDFIAEDLPEWNNRNQTGLDNQKLS